MRDFVDDVSWRPTPFTGVASVAKVAEAFDGGATLVVQGMHHWWPALATFCRSLESSLGHPAQANAYYTPREAQGLPVHHDTHDVFCLQIAGEKRWLVYEPVWELPLKNQRYDATMGAPGKPVLDVTLQPGDTLYLPRGWLHEAKTSDSDSLHLTIGASVYSWIDAFAAALDECADDPAFRHSPSGSPDELLARFGERLGEDEVQRRMRTKLVRTRRPVLHGQVGQLRALRELDLDTALERRATALADLASRDGTTELTFEGRTLEFPEHASPALEFVLGTDEPFSASDLPGTLDDEGRLALVARLVREGLLVSR